MLPFHVCFISFSLGVTAKVSRRTLLQGFGLSYITRPTTGLVLEQSKVASGCKLHEEMRRQEKNVSFYNLPAARGAHKGTYQRPTTYPLLCLRNCNFMRFSERVLVALIFFTAALSFKVVVNRSSKLASSFT